MAVDIYQKIERDFGANAKSVRQILEEVDARTKGLLSDRMVRCMIFLADGRLDAFKATVEVARTDSRDVYWQAEYDCGEKQLRDFTQSFHQLGLL